jgi:hypothetical protein
MSNYVQPDFRVPVTPVDSNGHALGTVTVQVENRGNPLSINAPQAAYSQPGTSAPPAPLAGQLNGGALGISIPQSNVGSSPAAGE